MSGSVTRNETPVRVCKCGRPGCFVPPGSTKARKWRDDACRQLGYRQRHAAARVEVEAAAERRGLAALLEAAAEEAQRRPGAVVLRVKGRLHALTVDELRVLLGRADQAAAAAELLGAVRRVAAQVLELGATEEVNASPGESVHDGTRLVPESGWRDLVAAIEDLVAHATDAAPGA